jgi:hypothetical protein
LVNTVIFICWAVVYRLLWCSVRNSNLPVYMKLKCNQHQPSFWEQVSHKILLLNFSVLIHFPFWNKVKKYNSACTVEYCRALSSINAQKCHYNKQWKNFLDVLIWKAAIKLCCSIGLTQFLLSIHVSAFP